MYTKISLQDGKWINDAPEKMKYIVANDRVNKKFMINGFIVRQKTNEYQYFLSWPNTEPLEILTAKKVLFGYEIFFFDTDGTKKKLGYLRKYSSKNYFVLFQEKFDKILIKFKNVILDQMKFRTIRVCLNFENTSVIHKYQKRITEKLFSLVNRMPKYDSVKNSYTLKFDEKTIVPSFKNFQLVSPSMPDHLTLSLGMVSDDKWAISHSFPWNATQAFSIALSAIVNNQ